MKLAKLLTRLGGICFLLMWIPFAIVMINGPLRLMSGNLDDMQTVESIFTSPWMYAMWALFAGTFVFFIASAIVSRLSNQRILASGQDAEAKILAIADTGTRINDNPVIDFSLQVQPANYPAFVAQARQTVSIIHLPSYQPGKIVNVKFVPGTDQVAIVGAKM
ncbi:MAG: hypothetical protein ABI954_08095 [Pyrinomonadaceae bacterium]